MRINYPRNTDRGTSSVWARVAVPLILAASFASSQAAGQQLDITGIVRAANSQLPLENAHVFVASSTIGTATDANGNFRLEDVPPGPHRLFVSMLGYESAQRDTLLRGSGTHTFSFDLIPAVFGLEEIVVSAREARRWQRRLLKFTRLFLGETPNSALAEIKNPEVLSFTSSWGRFSATASRPLVINNLALGYRIEYYLKEFFYYGNVIKYDGEPLFTELEPQDAEQSALWEANRIKAFNGSLRHYLLSLMDGVSEAEGFATYRRTSLDRQSPSFTADTEILLRSGPSPDEMELAFHGFLEVVYARELEDAAFHRWQRRTGRIQEQRSFLELNTGPTLVDRSGEVIDPYGVTVYGYYAFERIADEVPKDYRPPAWTQ